MKSEVDRTHRKHLELKRNFNKIRSWLRVSDTATDKVVECYNCRTAIKRFELVWRLRHAIKSRSNTPEAPGEEK